MDVLQNQHNTFIAKLKTTRPLKAEWNRTDILQLPFPAGAYCQNVVQISFTAGVVSKSISLERYYGKIRTNKGYFTGWYNKIWIQFQADMWRRLE